MGNLGLQEIFILLFLFIIPALYLNTLRKTLLLIDVKNRTIDPNYVWFMFIIGFNCMSSKKVDSLVVEGFVV